MFTLSFVLFFPSLLSVLGSIWHKSAHFPISPCGTVALPALNHPISSKINIKIASQNHSAKAYIKRSQCFIHALLWRVIVHRLVSCQPGSVKNLQTNHYKWTKITTTKKEKTRQYKTQQIQGTKSVRLTWVHLCDLPWFGWMRNTEEKKDFT